MEKVFFYSYPKCSTCRKVSKWLDENNINYQFKDIVKDPSSKETLAIALIQFSSDIKNILIEEVRGLN